MRDISDGIFAIILGIILGWGLAHGEVASECKKLNAFYVGNTTFTCAVKEQP